MLFQHYKLIVQTSKAKKDDFYQSNLVRYWMHAVNYTNMADSKYDVIYYCSIIRSNSMTFTSFSILTMCYNVCFSTHASRFKVVESSCFFSHNRR